MKHILHVGFGLTLLLLNSVTSNAQSPHTAYVVTDSVRLGTKWFYLRSVDTRTGQYSNSLLRLLNGPDTLPVNNVPNGVAAIGYDKKNKRLYFTPMQLDRLSYVDLRSMQIYTVANNFTGLVPKTPDQGNIITRMVIGEDDKGYALTNNGKALIRFSTGNNPSIVNMGSLQDAAGNLVSVHESCSSYGGDIIADDEGHLYLVTLRNHVFRIKLQTRVAQYLGTVSGLPVNFTTNGVAVNQHNELVLASSLDATDLYKVSLNSMAATPLQAGSLWHAADLANSNLLKSRLQEHRSLPGMIVSNEKIVNAGIQLFPNPVTTNEFRIQFMEMEAGDYTVDVMDVRGAIIVSKEVKIGLSKTNIVSINLPVITGKGIFIVRINDKNNQTYYREKIVVQ